MSDSNRDPPSLSNWNEIVDLAVAAALRRDRRQRRWVAARNAAAIACGFEAVLISNDWLILAELMAQLQ